MYAPGVRKRRYSELECFTLGLVWQLGPCSPYDVRRHMLGSPSTQWSASAGAIYPLVRRLHRRGLLSVKAKRTGKRARRVYRVTPAGMGVLRGWIGPPLDPEAITAVYDPLRSRARFLAAVPREQRRRWVAAAQAALEEVAARIRRWDEVYGSSGDPIAPLITRHGELDVRARSQWLEELRRGIDEHR